MATQTGWDHWGSPSASGDNHCITPTKQKQECDCKHNVKLLLDWKREMEHKMEDNDGRYKVKLNILREKVMKAEDERDKLRATIASLTKQIASNTATVTEMKVRNGDAAMNARPNGNSGNCAQNGNTGNAYRPQPQYTQRQQTSSSSNRGNSAPNQSRQSYPGPTEQVGKAGSAGTARPSNVQRPAGGSGRNSSNQQASQRAPDPTTQAKRSGNAGNPQGTPNVDRRPPYVAQQNLRSDDVRRHQGPPGGSQAGGSTKQTPNINVSSSTVNRTQSAQGACNYQITGGAYEVLGQEGMLSSWAEDHVSDAEIVAITEAPIPSNMGADQPSNVAKSSSEQRRADIFRDAILEVRKREEASRGLITPLTPQDSSLNIGEKRGNDRNLDGPSYAESVVNYDWLDADNKRRRRGNSGDNIPVLFGSKSTPQKDIFVRDLDYSECGKPADLEYRVKHHCRRRGVTVSFVKAFPIKSNCSKANCKVTVNSSDVMKVLFEGFWPQYASARIWTYQPSGQYDAANTMGDDLGECVQDQIITL